MNLVSVILATLALTAILCVKTLELLRAAQPTIAPQTVKDDLLTIKGETYVI